MRREALAALSGGERLVIMHGGRFGGTTTLLRAWLADGAQSSNSIFACIIGPEQNTTEAAYWSRLLGMFPEDV